MKYRTEQAEKEQAEKDEQAKQEQVQKEVLVLNISTLVFKAFHMLPLDTLVAIISRIVL